MTRPLIVVFLLFAWGESAHAQVQHNDTGNVTPESFLKQIEGKWALETLSDRGQVRKITPFYKDDFVTVQGRTISFVTRSGEHPYEIEDIAIKDGLVHASLVGSQDGKKWRWRETWKLDDGLLVLARHVRHPHHPDSIAPSEDNLVRTWRRVKPTNSDGGQ